MQKITPFIWYEKNAEQAAQYYVDIFNGNPAKRRDSKINLTTHYDKAGAEVSGQQEGTVLTVAFELEGMEITAINGGRPQMEGFSLNGAVSFVVKCESQQEVDYFWDKLSKGGEEGVCGWINRDKFGMTWQVVPEALPRLLSDPDPKKASKAMKAMLEMKKIIIEDLEKAAAQK